MQLFPPDKAYSAMNSLVKRILCLHAFLLTNHLLVSFLVLNLQAGLLIHHAISDENLSKNHLLR